MFRRGDMGAAESCADDSRVRHAQPGMRAPQRSVDRAPSVGLRDNHHVIEATPQTMPFRQNNEAEQQHMVEDSPGMRALSRCAKAHTKP